MNDDDPNLHPWIEPELEARLTALVLGEASDFERDELDRLVAERPELDLYRQRLEAMHRLLREVAGGEAFAAAGDWKLAPERRAVVLARWKGEDGAVEKPVAGAEPERRFRWGGVLRIAACLAVVGLFLGFLFSALFGISRTAGPPRPFAIGESTPSEAHGLPGHASREHDADTADLAALAGDQIYRAEPLPTGSDRGRFLKEENTENFGRKTAAPLPVAAPRPEQPQAMGGIAAGEPVPLAAVTSDPFAEPPSPASSPGSGGALLSTPTNSAPPLPSLGQTGAGTIAGRPVVTGKETEFYDRGDVDAEPERPWTQPGRFEEDKANRMAMEFRFTESSSPERATPRAGWTDHFASREGSGGTEGFALDFISTAEHDAKRDKSALAAEPTAVSRFGLEAPMDESVADILALTPQVGTTHRFGAESGLPSGDSFAVSPDARRSDEVANVRLGAPLAGGLGFESPPKEVATISPADRGLETRVYRVPPTFLSLFDDRAKDGDPFADPVSAGSGARLSGRATAKEILESAGIQFPEGAAAIYNPETSELMVRNTKDQSELVEAYIESVGTAESAPRPKPAVSPAALGEVSPAAEPFSTFSLHVGDVSFQLAKAALASGRWPEAAKIRIEEFVNALDYGDPLPAMGERVACRVDQAVHPFLQQRQLVRIALRTAEAGRSSGTPLRLTLLLDSSGSMERPDRRETVKIAVATLAELLNENDRVTLVSFARQPRLVAEEVPGSEASRLAETVAALPSEGGTNLEAALDLAFEKAREHRDPAAQNRIVLLTDGAANLGDAKAENLGARVERMREAGIAFDAAGFGAEGLNDEILEALARKGDGRYFLLDRPEDAGEAFAQQIAGALRPAAKNVKVQVEFNPERVRSYKLLGFEKHRLATEDFRNDAVDAAEMAAAEAGVAVYQVEADPAGQGDLGSVSVRFRDLDSGAMVERRWALPHLSAIPAVDQAPDSIRMATVASQLAAKLAGGPLGDAVDLDELARLAATLPDGPRFAELRTMIEQARALEGARGVNF